MTRRRFGLNWPSSEITSSVRASANGSLAGFSARFLSGRTAIKMGRPEETTGFEISASTGASPDLGEPGPWLKLPAERGSSTRHRSRRGMHKLFLFYDVGAAGRATLLLAPSGGPYEGCVLDRPRFPLRNQDASHGLEWQYLASRAFPHLTF